MTSDSSSAGRRDRIVDALRETVCDLSGLPPDEVASDATFFELGFDSLMMTQLSTAFERSLGAPVTFRELMESYPTLGDVAGHFDRQLPADRFATSAAPAAPESAPAAAAASSTPLPPSDGRLEGVFARQLEVMAEQLRMLGAREGPAAERAARAEPPAAPSPQQAPAKAPPSPPAARPASPPRERGLNAHQKRELAEFVRRYNRRTAGSKAAAARHRTAHADPRTAAGFSPLYKDVVYPIVVERSQGALLWDVDGNEYVDILCGFGPTFLGHSSPVVMEAVRRQLDAGFEVGPMTPLAGETAELVCHLTGMDRASFVCTGSEAVQAALRCARTVTGRDRIATFKRDYHGNFDEVLVRGVGSGDRRRTFPAAPGIPRRTVADILVLDYGDPESLEVIREHAHELAAVLVEPVQSRMPELQPREFLHELRDITRDAGCLLIFDEVVTGFRCHPGGAQAVFGVEADLATYGKVVAGGMPIGVVAGRRPYMDAFDGGPWAYGDDSIPEAGVTFFAGTFVRHPLAIAAANGVLKHLVAEGPALQKGLNATCERFAGRLQEVCRETGAAIEVPHFASVMYIRLKEEGELAPLFFTHLMERGVHAGSGFPSYLTTAHTEAHLDHVVDAFRDSILAMQRARFFAPPSDEGLSRGAPVQRADGVPDRPPVEGARLGRDPSGAPAWYVADPDRPGHYVRCG